MSFVLVLSVGAGTGVRGGLPRSGAAHRSGLSEVEVETLVTVSCAVAELVETRCLWCPQLHDPADEIVLDAAINGGHDGLVTYRQDFGQSPARFGIALPTPQQALRRLPS